MRKIKPSKGLTMCSSILRLPILTLFLLSFFWQQGAQAQAPISTQAEINDLVANCGCTVFPGNLIIGGNGDITDLTPLSPLTSVDGLLVLTAFSTPISLNGLHNITTVGQNLAIAFNFVQLDFSELSSLTTVNGDVGITQNPGLVNVDGLTNLTTIGGGLTLTQNPLLENIDGLSGVTSIGASDNNGIGLQITTNELLSECCGVSDLIANAGITGTIDINGNLTNCNSEAEIAAVCSPDPDDDGDGVTVGQGDCDDTDPNNFPGNPEICDGQDNNCDGEIDEGLSGEVYTGSVIFNTQSEIDEWLPCYSSITGNIGIKGGSGAITDLTPLSGLTSIGGSLQIDFFSTPISLIGLDNITSIGEGFFILENSVNLDFTELSSLNSIGLDILIASNSAITNLDGLNNVNTVGGYLIVTNNALLSDISGLESISSIAGSAITGIGLNLTLNPLLSECCEIYDLLNNPTSISGTITIADNATDCNSEVEINAACAPDPDDDGDGVTVGQGDCDDTDPNNFPGNPEICDGQDNNCDGEIDEGLSGLTFVGNVVFEEQTDIDAWPSCYTTIDGNLVITNNGPNTVTDLSPIGGITLVTGSVNINSLNLTSLQGLGLEMINSNFSITNNDFLVNLEGLESLTSVGTLFISNNDNMETIDGLEGLTTAGSIDIEDMPSLTNVDGLINLTQAFSIDIQFNDALTNVDGLANIMSLDNLLSITFNPQLTDCCGVYELLATPGALPIGSFIAGNDTGCDNPAEVISNCETDEDMDGVSVLEGDCDDADGNNFPGNPEICDGQDNNCDGETDEGFDLDGDQIADCFDPCPLAPTTITNFDESTCNCLPGYFPITETIGDATITTACQPCPAGSFCPDGISQQLCPPGSFSSMTGQSECALCPSGTFSETEGTTACSSCPAGTFQPEIGAAECYTCCENTSSIEGSTSCDPGPWSAFDDCSGECGEGTQNRTRAITTYDAGIVTCEVETETQVCTNVDEEAPIALCQNTSIDLDENGNASITTMDIDNGTSDACGFTLELSQTDFTCDNLGPNTVTLTAVDPSGNTGTCEAEVSINDPIGSCDNGTDYCESYGESTQYEWIENIAVNGNDYTSGDNGGYGDFTGTTIPLATGWNSLELMPGFAGDVYGEYWTVFIDYNQDGTFDVATETAYYGASYYDIYTSINVPSDAPTGTTRMRIAMRFGQYAYPCDVFAEGEVEDYTVEISACDNITDGGEIGDDEALCETDNDPAEMLSLADANGGSGTIEYVWLMNTTTSTPPTAYNMNGWTEIAGSNSPSYDPGPISETTWYLRCARQSGCIQYSGESNVIEKAYEAVCPLVYCDSEGSNTNYEWIKKVVIGNIHNYSGNNGGYADFTYLSTGLSCGQSQTITLKPGYAGNAYAEYWSVWVDWNQDGDFDDAGELEVQTAGYYTRYGTISAPNDAVHGDTRMRVSMSYNGYPSACDAFQYGEVEDYTIHVNGNAGLVVINEDDKGEDNSATTYSEDENDRQTTAIGTGSVDVFPNPATNHVFVNLNAFAGKAVDVQIINSFGQVIIQQQIAEVLDQRLQFDLSTFETGHYVVTVITADGERIAKGLVVRK